jgi:hypothetical protein
VCEIIALRRRRSNPDGSWWMVGNLETHFLATRHRAEYLLCKRAILKTALPSFLTRIVQTDEEPVKVALRLASLDL